VSISLRLTAPARRPPTSRIQATISNLSGSSTTLRHTVQQFFPCSVCFAFPAAAPGQVHIVIHPGNNYCVHINIEAEEAKRVYRLAAMAGIMMPSKLNGKWMGL